MHDRVLQEHQRREGASARLDLLAGQHSLAQQLVAPARLVVVQAHRQRGVLRHAVEAGGVVRGEVRLQAVLGRHLIRGLPGQRQLHQRVGQLVGLEGHHNACTQRMRGPATPMMSRLQQHTC